MPCETMCKDLNMLKMPFASKLYRMLEDAEKEQDKAEIVSWLPDGSGFMIHKQDEFIETALK